MPENILSECENEHRPYLLGINPQKHLALLYRPDCKLWSCPHCANVKAKQWGSRVRGAIKQNQREEDAQDQWHFLTITIKDDSGKLERQIEIFRGAWDKLSKRAKRACPHAFTYVLIPELSPKTSRLHAHMLVTWDFGRDRKMHRRKDKDGQWEWFWYSAWLHANLHNSGLGYIYDLQPLRNENQAASYVAKYVGKGLSEVFPSSFRRVRTSQDFPSYEEENPGSDYEWSVLTANAEGGHKLYRAMLNTDGIRDINRKNRVTTRHPLIQLWTGKLTI